jgi:hypothetical protein
VPRNKFKVPPKQWRRWSALARTVFNRVYDAMEDQSVYLHPKATPALERHWKTTRWNAAWVAADAVDGGEAVR